MIVNRRAGFVAVLVTAVTVLAACSGSSGGSPSSGAGSSGAASGGSVAGSSAASSGSASGSASSSQPALAADQQTYVSIGDSYAAGYQPSARGRGATGRNGFAYQVVDKARAKGYDLTLINFGCSGATTSSALSTPGCRDRNLGPGAPSYDTPQVTAAVDYLRAHSGKVGLITIALGGNDITACADATSTGEATSCVTSALGKITSALGTITARLRAAAGPATRIVGITYPDVFLGEALSSDPERKSLADLSVFAFRSLINPQLQSAYAKAGASFADVTDATGAYTPKTQTTTLAPYGTIPVAVAKVCTLTYFCQYGDIHPRTAGYGIIADLVVGALPAR